MIDMCMYSRRVLQLLSSIRLCKKSAQLNEGKDIDLEQEIAAHKLAETKCNKLVKDFLVHIAVVGGYLIFCRVDSWESTRPPEIELHNSI